SVQFHSVPCPLVIANSRPQLRFLPAIAELDGKADEISGIHQDASMESRKSPGDPQLSHIAGAIHASSGSTLVHKAGTEGGFPI
ncbi:MAG: hypothetical protein ACREJM_04315, partial [Candidatus Saccharimonadales bacterium]